MGAIVVNQLVQAFPDLNYESIVYLSGAATVRDTKAALEPVLRQHGGRTTFYNLMLHPAAEANLLRTAELLAEDDAALDAVAADLLAGPCTLVTAIFFAEFRASKARTNSACGVFARKS